MAQVTELITAFKFEGDTKPLKMFNTQMSDAIGLIAKSTALFAAGAVALNAFVVSTLAEADALGQLSNELGVAVEEIQKLGFVASVNGSDVNSLTQSLEGLNEKIGEAAIQGNETFNRLGVNIRKANGEIKSADQVLLEIGNRFKELNLSTAEQSRILAELQINKNLAQTLRLSANELNALRNEAEAFGLVTEEQTKQIIEFNDSLTKAKFGADALRKQIAISLAPQISSLSKDFIEFLKANKEVIGKGVGKLFKVLNAGVGSIFRVSGAIVDLIDNTIGLKTATVLLAGAVLALNRSFLLSPLGLTIAGLTTLFLAVDDLIVAFQGGQSVIKDFFEDSFGIDIVQKITNLINKLKEFANFVTNNELTRFIGIGGDIFPTNSDRLVAPQTNNNQSSVVTQNITQNITTDNPQVAGEVAAQSMKREFEVVKNLNNRGNF